MIGIYPAGTPLPPGILGNPAYTVSWDQAGGGWRVAATQPVAPGLGPISVDAMNLPTIPPPILGGRSLASRRIPQAEGLPPVPAVVPPPVVPPPPAVPAAAVLPRAGLAAETMGTQAPPAAPAAVPVPQPPGPLAASGLPPIPPVTSVWKGNESLTNIRKPVG